MAQLVRVQNFGVSSDGYGAGSGQSLEHPFGDVDAGDILGWIFSTASFAWHTEGAVRRGLDDYFARDFHNNIGAEIMGRNKFSPYRGPWENADWNGWWGEEPPFHTPVFVLSHYARPSFSLGETTFHFINESPERALEIAKEAANGKDVRIGGGVSTVRQFLDAGLIDTLHVSVSPVEFGHGERLWESHEELLDRYHLESVPSSSGVTHLIFWRK